MRIMTRAQSDYTFFFQDTSHLNTTFRFAQFTAPSVEYFAFLKPKHRFKRCQIENI